MVRLLQFIVIMSYLAQTSPEPLFEADSASAAAAEMTRIADVIADVISHVRVDAAWIETVFPQLPTEWRRYLDSFAFVETATAEFDLLDANRNTPLHTRVPNSLSATCKAASQPTPSSMEVTTADNCCPTRVS